MFEISQNDIASMKDYVAEHPFSQNNYHAGCNDCSDACASACNGCSSGCHGNSK